MLNIRNGKIPRPQRVVIYGPEGVGKTTLAAQFLEPLFIDTEGGTAHMDVRRIDRPATWDELIAIINEVAATSGICKTLVVDTADWAEQLATTYICGKYKKNGIEEFGYSKGYVYLAEEFGRFLIALDKVIASGVHVVVTAHAKMRKFEQPDEMGAYDRWETKLTKQVAPLLKEWCDMLLFCNYRTFVVQSDNAMEKAKAEAPAQAKPIEVLHQMMAEANVTDAEIQKVVSSKGHYTADVPISDYTEKFLNGWLIKYWPQVLKPIEADRTGLN